MPVPYTFGTATSAIPLSQLDSNFATAITLGNTAVYLGNTTTSIGNLTLTNVTISSGEVTTGNVSVAGNVTLTGGTANGVAYLNTSKALTTGSALVFDGSNLGVGVTPSAWQANNRAIQLLEGYASISSNNSQGCCDVAFNCFNGGSAATSGWKYTNTGVAVSLFQQQAGAFKFLTAASGTAGNAISFTQAMTLDASGNLLVGTTNTAQSTGVGAKILAAGVMYVVAASGPDGFSFYNTTAGGYRFYVNTGGTINATSATITPIISDERSKQNIVDYSNGLSQVLGLRPRYFEYKKEPGRKLAGFISQEVQTVMPEAIVPTREDPEMMTYSIDWYPLFVKAIQEQQALIIQLAARITALESA